MPKNIKQLEKLWNREKEQYRFQEIGSGVQRFVKEVLNSPEIFNIRKAELATKIENRENEFLEEKAKQNRRADVIIFIDSERIIPVEVERYGNIKAGREQLFNYQRVWEKKYGILTDGDLWKFYNNKILVKQFRIEDILDRTGEFLEFWKEYIQLKNYYLQFFENIGQLELFEEDLSLENKRQNFFQDITTLIKSFKNKLNLKGYFDKFGEKESEKKAVEITYAYIIQFILYKTLVDNEFEDFKEDFNKRLNEIYKDIKTETYGDIIRKIKAISNIISENVYRPFVKEQEFINQKLENILDRPQNELNEVTPWLDIFIFIKRYSFINVRTEIFGYIYENYLKDLYIYEKKGQFFTDPAIVDFMLKQMGYTAEDIKNRVSANENNISLIDPSCGSGTFLYSAVRNIMEAIPNGSLEASKKIEEIINENVFGLDIEEFPIYLAEMSIIMRILPLIINEKYNNRVEKKIKVFKTIDSISEFLDTSLKNNIYDLKEDYESKGQTQLFTERLNLGYSSYVRDEDDLKEMKKSVENLHDIPRRRFDFVIGNPPYIGYNQCSKQGILVFKYIKENEVKLNNIYGVNLHSIPENRKKYPPKPNLYAFFIALGIALLKDSGKLCYIIPQTILTAGDLDVIRYHLAKFTTIEKIIIFSGKMFVGRGIKQNKPVPTSSLIFVVSRKQSNYINKVEIINYLEKNDDIEKCLENIINNKRVTKKKILQNTLLENVENWNFIKQNKKLLDLYDEYKRLSEDIAIYYYHASAKQKFNSNFYFDIGFTLDPKEIKTTKDNNNLYELLDFKTFYDYSRFMPKAYYTKDKTKIKLTKNNQGYITLEQNYKIVWSIKNPDRFCFTDHQIIFYMGKSPIICSNNKDEIYYLLSLLNSSTNKLILTSILKSENEKDYLVPIKSIKQFVRVPKVKGFNKLIKDEIIRRTGEMLKLEEVKISELIDFSGIMMQKFDKILIDEKDLILIKNDEKMKCKIKNKRELVSKIINEKFIGEELNLSDKKINLSELKSTPAIDYEKQKAIKDYIDDLVFSIYFNVKIKEIGFEFAEKIKKECKKNKFYEIIEN